MPKENGGHVHVSNSKMAFVFARSEFKTCLESVILKVISVKVEYWCRHIACDELFHQGVFNGFHVVQGKCNFWKFPENHWTLERVSNMETLARVLLLFDRF